MVIRGTRASLARTRMIRSARRSRSGKVLSNRSSRNTSSRLNNSSKTNNASQTKQTKQIAMYEEMQKVADDMQKIAKTLLELGVVKTETTGKTENATPTESAAKTENVTSAESAAKTENVTSAESAAKTENATSAESAAKTEGAAQAETKTKQNTVEEQKKEIIACVKDLVEQYNTIYENLDELGGTVNTLFISKLKQLVNNFETELAKTGISMNRNGTLSITTKTLENTDLNTLKSVYCKENGIVNKLAERAENIESNAASTIRVMNRMYGTQSSYNKYGTSSAYYGNSGSWYNAIG